MARLPYLNIDDLEPKDQDVLSRNINLYRVLAHSPMAARKFSGLGGYIRHNSKLDPRLRELAILQVGYLTGAEYEFSHHIKIGRDFGVSDEDIRGMIDESHGRDNQLDLLAKTVLRAAREMTLDLSATEETMIALRNAMNMECLNDLILTISFYNCVVRYLATMQIEVEDDYLPYLKEFPLPPD